MKGAEKKGNFFSSYQWCRSRSCGGVTGRPETMCPLTNVLEPLVPWINRPRNTLSLSQDWYIPIIICMIIYIYGIKMTGMYQSRDLVWQGTINFGTGGPRTFVKGHIVKGRPVTPPIRSDPFRFARIRIHETWSKTSSTFYHRHNVSFRNWKRLRHMPKAKGREDKEPDLDPDSESVLKWNVRSGFT